MQGTVGILSNLLYFSFGKDLKNNDLLKDVNLLFQIHDELVFEIKEEALDKAIPIIKEAMESVLSRSYLKYKTPIPILVNYKVGDSLGDVK